MVDMSEKIVRDVSRLFIEIMVDGIGKLFTSSGTRRTGPATTRLNANEDTLTRFSIHLDTKAKK